MGEKFKIAIIDYGMGNVRSIENAINHVGNFEISLTSNHSDILLADCIILPGVGAFPDAMKNLNDKNLVEVLYRAVMIEQKPTLGICLGMQLLFEFSEEAGHTQGLGWIPGKVVHMEPGNDLRVPHIGWNSLVLQGRNSLFDYLGNDKDFYFVHSYYANCDDKYIIAKFDYGNKMTAAVANGNVMGMQFHPEKSQKNGLAALKTFLDQAVKTVEETGVYSA